MPSFRMIRWSSILTKMFTDLMMDFVEGMPKSQGRFVVFEVVDKLTNYNHFIRLQHPFSITTLAILAGSFQITRSNIVTVHHLPPIDRWANKGHQLVPGDLSTLHGRGLTSHLVQMVVLV